MKENFNTKEIHQKAMLLSQDAFVLTARGRAAEALPLNEQAFELERQAALSLLDRKDLEPTRSILFRSAAVIARDCFKYEDAEKMILLGLAGNPPEDIEEELREVYATLKKFLLPKKSPKVLKQKAVVNA